MSTPQRHSRTEQAELNRIRRVYAGRSTLGTDRSHGAYAGATHLWLHQRERLLLTGLGAKCEKELRDLEILDVGCGAGGELLRLVSHGADPARIHGVDLREEPIRIAQGRLPPADLRVGNAAELSYPDDSMDLVLQFTMLSSVLDRQLRSSIAREMARVVRPGGLIVSYDFWTNPLNANTRGLTRREIRELFPHHRIDARSVTLAPPIARLVCPRSYGLAAALQAVPLLRTHVLAFIGPARGEASSP
jgi:ubiquinone/menaquinone biosynthesis C-methylase UbiE